MPMRIVSLIAVLAAVAPATAHARQAAPSITGGTLASRPFAHHAFVSIATPGFQAQCAGTLLAARFVATAAHCFSGPDGRLVSPGQVRVGLGSQSVSTITDVYAVSAIDRHPSFALLQGGTADVPDFDLAVLRLARPAPYAPAPLVDGDSQAAVWQPGIAATIIGWGQTEAGTPSDALLEAMVPVRTDAACAAAYGGLFRPGTMLCAGTGIQDSCAGDSGGPLLVPSGGELLLAGITSWGRGCGDPRFPGVYAQVGSEPLQGWLRTQLPNAGFTVTPADPEAGQPVILTSTSSNPVDAFTALEWDLDGDGAYDDAAGTTVQSAFDRGVHGVGLRASNGQGDLETAQGSIEALARTRVSFGQSDFAVTEGDQLSVPVSVLAPPFRQGTGTAAIALGSGSAAPGRDFDALPPAVLTFGPGDATRPLGVRTAEDALDEPPETVILVLGSTSGSLVSDAPAQATITIRDDDRPRNLRYTIGRVRRDGSVLLRTAFPAPGRVTVSLRQPSTGRVLATGRSVRRGAGRAAVRVTLRSSVRRELRLRQRRTVLVTVRFTSSVTGDSSVSRRRGQLRSAERPRRRDRGSTRGRGSARRSTSRTG